MDLNDEQRKRLVQVLGDWLGEEGIAFFSEMAEKHGTVSAVFSIPYGDESFGPQKFYPHSVHFREGMQVRNFLRTLPDTDGWDSHDYDKHWAPLVTEVISRKAALRKHHLPD